MGRLIQAMVGNACNFSQSVGAGSTSTETRSALLTLVSMPSVTMVANKQWPTQEFCSRD